MASSALGLVQVSEPDKNFLFEEAIKDSGHCIKRSQRALAQLNSFQPLLSRDFAIREFGGAKAPFRLLFDLPVLNQHPFGNTTRSFIALSYCWHDGTWEPHQGLGRHQKPWPIAPSMLSALRAERLSLEEGIWIDQLCIDQECESEKRHAIGEMDLIYKSARVVVAVLEDIIVSSSEEVILHGLLNDKSRDTQDLFDDLNKHAKEQATLVLFRILSARWFRRAWCSHELQVSTALIFILPTPKGTYRMTTQSLEDFYSATVDFRTESGLEDKYYNVESYDFLTRSFYDEADRGEKSLLCQFSDNMKLGSTIESDKISISMNIVGLQLIYFCPRRTEDQCKWILAMLALSSGEALALCGIEEALTIDNPHAQYPAESWLRWYDEIEDPMSPFGGSRLEQPSYIAAIDERYINLELFCIQKLSFLIPTVDSLQRAGGFVNEFLSLCKVKHEFSLMSVDSIAGNGIVTHEPLIQILSCSIECGRRWMVKQMASVKEVAEQMRTKLKKLKFDLWPIVHKMLECTAIYQSTDREGITSVDQSLILEYITFILMYYQEISLKHSQYNSGVYANGEDIASQWMGVKIGTDNWALVPRGTGISMPSATTRICVVPVALSGWSCTLLRRSWILDLDLNPGIKDTWKIVQKLPFFTLTPILADESCVVRLRSQTITS